MAKHDDTERKIKHVSDNTVQQIGKLEKRVRELENEATKEKTERTEDTAALQRIDTVRNESKNTSGGVRTHGYAAEPEDTETATRRPHR